MYTVAYSNSCQPVLHYKSSGTTNSGDKGEGRPTLKSCKCALVKNIYVNNLCYCIMIHNVHSIYRTR